MNQRLSALAAAVRRFFSPVDRLAQAIPSMIAAALPREVVYRAGLRVLRDVTERPDLSKVMRQVAQGEVRMLHALDVWINEGRKR